MQEVSLSGLEEIFLEQNPVRLDGVFADTGGTCGFSGFNDEVFIYQYPAIRVELGEGNPAPGEPVPTEIVPLEVMGYYEGTILADGTGTLRSTHIEEACEHTWT